MSEHKNTRIKKLAIQIKADPEMSMEDMTDKGYKVFATLEYRLIEVYDFNKYCGKGYANYEKEAARFLDQQIIFTSK